MGRSVLIYVMGSFIILSIALLTSSKNVDSTGSQAVSYMRYNSARNVCNSMTSVLISRIADSTALRVETPITTTFMGAEVTYQIKSVSSIGNISNDDHHSNDHESDDHGDDHGGDDHGGDGHEGGDHSSIFNSTFSEINQNLFAASIFAAFDDDHSEGDDHGGDDHSGDDHSRDSHDGHHHEDNDHEGDGDPSNGDTVKIVVTATIASTTKTLTTYVGINPPIVPSTTAMRGGVTSNAPISTSGNMQVDGRNHDLNGNLIAGTGTYGVWTTSTLSQGGSSDIGGTYSGSDYAPSKPANSHVVKTSASYPSGSFPDSPDKVFGGSSAGFPEGTLKNIAISGTNGSQYVTDPSSLSSPFSGLTYVELPSGSTWQSMNITGTGILIVHNAAGNAQMKNLNSGTFKGLIIVDDLVHVHTTIIGAVIGISSSLSDGSLLGNGNGSILYSKDAVDQAFTQAGSNSTSNNYGFGKTRLNVLGWYD